MDKEQKEKEIVSAFGEKMLAKIQIRHNRYQPLGWATMDIKRLLSLMKGEIEELESSLSESNPKEAAEESVDIANYALFIHEVLNESISNNP